MDMDTFVGFTFRDRVTGFVGEATGFYAVFNGKRMVRRLRLIHGQHGAAVRISRWFDLNQLEQVFDPGPPQPAAAHAASS